MDLILYFIITFTVTFFISYITIIRKCLKEQNKSKKKKDKKLPVEVDYLIRRYKLDLDNINYKKLLYIISIVASIDMATTVVVVSPIKNIYLQAIIGFVILIPLILITYNGVGNYYIKKGLIKDGNKKNRK